MRTLYVDVYFLLDFSVDLIALSLSGSVIHRRGSPLRLTAAAALSGAYSVLALFLPLAPFALFSLSLAVFALAVKIAVGRVGFRRYVRFALVFFLIETTLGGLVHFLYERLGKLLQNSEIITKTVAENRKLLILAVLVFFGVSLLRLLLRLLSPVLSERVVSVSIPTEDGRYATVDALVDTGNFLSDPMSGTPVLLVKSGALRGVLPEDFLPDALPSGMKTRFVAVPYRTGGSSSILDGFRFDDVKITLSGKEITVRLIVATDREGGSFDGHPALMPAAALQDAS